jgi:hypothetical protein
MKQFKTDKYGDVVPAMSESDYAALKASIAAEGCLQPLEVDRHGDGNLLDGHNRWRAINELKAEGIDVKFAVRLVRCHDDKAARSYIRAVNLVRRHLSTADKQKLIADELRDNPTDSNRKIAAALGFDHKTVGAKREAMRATGEIPQLSQTTGKDGKTRTAKRKGSPSKRGKRSTAQADVGDVANTLATTEGAPNLDWLNGPTDAKEQAYNQRTLAFQTALIALVASYDDVVAEPRFEQKNGRWIIDVIEFDHFEPDQTQVGNNSSRANDQARGVKGEYQINRVIGRTVRTEGRSQAGECFEVHFLEADVEYGNPEASVIGKADTMDATKALAERHHRSRTLY